MNKQNIKEIDHLKIYKQYPLKRLIRNKQNIQNGYAHQSLTYTQIQAITRSVLKNPKPYDQNIGVISSIKGKMYCLKLGQVSKSKQFQHFFISKQFRMRQAKSVMHNKHPQSMQYKDRIKYLLND